MIDVSERDLVTIQGFLAKHVSECAVWAFGSRATWTAKEHSDLDLVIVGPNKIETRVLESLKEAFDESALPFRVDVLDWHRISPEFKRNIEKNYVVIRKAGQKSTNGWQYYKVSDFAEVVGGGTPKTGVPEYWGGDIPWITPKDLSDHKEKFIIRGERSITEEGLKNSATRILPEDTVLLTSRAPVGYLAIAKKPVTTNQGFRNLIIKKGFSPEFIYYLLLNNVDYLKQHASGSTFQELSGSTLKNLQFQIPTYPEQKAIAKILTDLDEKIELNQQINKTLESIAQALFKQWFIDFEFPGSEKTRIIDGRPEGWHVSKLGDFSEIINGFAFKSEDFADSGIFLLRTRNFSEDGYIVRDDTACLPENFYYEYSNFRLKKFDVLLVMVGASIGKMATVQSSVLPALQNQNMWNFRSKKGFGQLFLNFLVKKIVKENMGSASGSARDFFRKDYFRRIDFILPSENILKDFDDKMSSIFDCIDKNLTETQILSQMRDSLLPKLMSGKIRIQEKD